MDNNGTTSGLDATKSTLQQTLDVGNAKPSDVDAGAAGAAVDETDAASGPVPTVDAATAPDVTATATATATASPSVSATTFSTHTTAGSDAHTNDTPPATVHISETPAYRRIMAYLDEQSARFFFLRDELDDLTEQWTDVSRLPADAPHRVAILQYLCEEKRRHDARQAELDSVMARMQSPGWVSAILRPEG